MDDTLAFMGMYRTYRECGQEPPNIIEQVIDNASELLQAEAEDLGEQLKGRVTQADENLDASADEARASSRWSQLQQQALIRRQTLQLLQDESSSLEEKLATGEQRLAKRVQRQKEMAERLADFQNKLGSMPQGAHPSEQIINLAGSAASAYASQQ